MRTQPVVKALQTALRTQAAMAGVEPAVEDAVGQLLEAMEPAMQLAVMQLAEQAAIEVGAQLPDHTVDVVLQDGEPTLRVTERKAPPAAATEAPSSEEFDARITLRLPPSLKEAVEQAAVTQGASVNAWVVDAIDRSAKKMKRRGGNITEEFDL
jgi:HicB family